MSKVTNTYAVNIPRCEIGKPLVFILKFGNLQVLKTSRLSNKILNDFFTPYLISFAYIAIFQVLQPQEINAV